MMMMDSMFDEGDILVMAPPPPLFFHDQEDAPAIPSLVDDSLASLSLQPPPSVSSPPLALSPISSELSTPGLPLSGGRKRARESAGPDEAADESLALDPKKMKRVMSNRESAERSRQRKKTYMVQLSESVVSLREENKEVSVALLRLQAVNAALRREFDEMAALVREIARSRGSVSSTP